MIHEESETRTRQVLAIVFLAKPVAFEVRDGFFDVSLLSFCPTLLLDNRGIDNRIFCRSSRGMSPSSTGPLVKMSKDSKYAL